VYLYYRVKITESKETILIYLTPKILRLVGKTNTAEKVLGGGFNIAALL